MTRRRRRGQDGIDLLIAELVPTEGILARWEEVDATHRRWIVVISRGSGSLVLSYLRGPMNGGHWGHDAELGEVPLAGWRDEALFAQAPPRVRELVARCAREAGVESRPAKARRRSEAP